LAGVLSVAGLLAGWSPPVAAQARKKVVVAVAPSVDMSSLIIAVKKGFLEKQGLDPQLKIFDSSPQAVQVLVAGQGDITQNTEPPHLAARARGGKVVQVLTAYLSGRTNGAVNRTDLIARHEDFAGKTIGVQRGSGAHYHLAWFLERYKIPPDKVSIKFMAAPDQIPALARNDIQAFFSWEPFLTRAATTIPNVKLWSRAVDDGLEYHGNVLMREELARNDPDTAGRVVKGLIETADWMRANLREAARVANEVLRAPSEEDAYQQLQFFKWPGEFRKTVLENELRIAQWGAGIGLFPTGDPKKLVEELVHPALVKAVAPDRTDM
jgi:ABC-type nitrate/sulfonate/bicarbonate transport system substrate-binding protein